MGFSELHKIKVSTFMYTNALCYGLYQIINYMKGGITIDNSNMFVGYPDIVSIDELQSMLNIGRNTAYNLLKDNLIKTIKVGKKYIIPKASVINFVMQGI